MQSLIFNANDFNRFEDKVIHWMEQFGLSEWTYEVAQNQIGEGRLASTAIASKGRSLLFELTEVCEGDFSLGATPEELALHEVLHVLLADLLKETARTGCDTAESVVAFEHGVINRLMKVFRNLSEG